MRTAMAPTTARESLAENRTMAMAETTRPPKRASFQLWATGEKSGGAGRNCAVVVMILWFQGEKIGAQESPAPQLTNYSIRPTSFSLSCWNLAMLSSVVLASCLPVMARSNWSCCCVSNSKNCGTCQTSFCQSSCGAHARFQGRYVTYLGSSYTAFTADWPPPCANWC